MPVQRRNDGVPVVSFDPTLEVTPFELFTRLREGVDVPMLVDLREGTTAWRLRGSVLASQTEIEPPVDRDAVFYDQDGTLSAKSVRSWRERGYIRTWALMGGIDLYRFCLDPDVLETDTFLQQTSASGEPDSPAPKSGEQCEEW